MISYIGAIKQDGCAFCCEFACQLTPTPTPHIDDQGRQVFLQSAGQFLFVVEGRRGASNRDPGTNILPFGDDQGDLQILLSRPIGDIHDPGGFGSPAVCDKGPPPTPFGGVPGIDPPVFDTSPAVTAALQDMQCRFSIQETTAVACTKNRFGDFSYLGSGTRRQFCYQVPMSAAFQPGDTVVSVRLRDVTGNLGPSREIIIRVLP